MSRLYELKSHSYEGDVATIIDLDKVCWLQIEKKPGQHYPHLVVRFVDGHEWHDLMIDKSAGQLVEACRAYLSGAPKKMENEYGLPAGFSRSREGSRLSPTRSGSAN